MAAANNMKIQMGVGGYNIPDSYLLEEATKTVVSFFSGRRGDAIARAKDGRVILPARGSPVLPGDVWEGRLELARSGRCYIFYPERPLKAAKYSNVPPHCSIFVNGQIHFTFVRIKNSQGEEGLIKVTPHEAVDFKVLLASVASVASRFHIDLLDSREAMESINGLKELYGSSTVTYDSKRLRELLRGIPEKVVSTLDHYKHEWKREAGVLRCKCGKWKPQGRKQRNVLSEAIESPWYDRKRHSRFTPKRRAKKRKDRPYWSVKGMHRRKVVHARKRYKTAQTRRRTRRTTKRLGMSAMWQSRRRW